MLLAFNWRWIFLVNVPIGIVAILIGWWKLPQVQGHDAPRPNAFAALLVTVGIAALVYAIVTVNDTGLTSTPIVISLALSVICLGLFVRHCLRAKNPFVDPALFSIRPFTGAVLVMAPYSIAFGAMLLSIALWMQSVWGWTALQTGVAIAPGPFLVPVTSLLLAGRLIARFGAAAVVTAGIACFAGGLLVWGALIGPVPNVLVAECGMVLTGIGVGLTFPTLMGVAMASVPPSAFATGSGVINMIRQAALAIGVAMFVAIVGNTTDAAARTNAFHLGWWIMAAITLAGLVPTYVFIRKRA